MIILEPKVYLTSQTQFNYDMFIQFLLDEGIDVEGSLRGESDAECTVEAAARLCYMSYGKGRRDSKSFINNILNAKHGSVLEHVTYGFIISGVSRTLTHELVRHRAGFAFSQLSQRFYDEASANFVIPPIYLDYDIDTRVIKADFTDALEAYKCNVQRLQSLTPQLAKSTKARKAVKEAARAVLPNATETKIYVTANVRSWRHFLELRGSVYADPEIRRLAVLIAEILKEEAPILFGDIAFEDVDGTQCITVDYNKV